MLFFTFPMQLLCHHRLYCGSHNPQTKQATVNTNTICDNKEKQQLQLQGPDLNDPSTKTDSSVAMRTG
ncbi:hypothetical protein HJC23_004950 [Cyclotella cryptica]|uniref:Uncharacterized protein n=1 Tax=Cyclotella cryptica TaxID=29204 RepID=A0ABD3PT02_9STRA